MTVKRVIGPNRNKEGRSHASERVGIADILAATAPNVQGTHSRQRTRSTAAGTADLISCTLSNARVATAARPGGVSPRAVKARKVGLRALAAEPRSAGEVCVYVHVYE